MSKPSCPVCEAAVSLDESPVAGEILQCPDCGAELELVGVAPPKLEKAPEVEEDWGE